MISEHLPYAAAAYSQSLKQSFQDIWLGINIPYLKAVVPKWWVTVQKWVLG